MPDIEKALITKASKLTQDYLKIGNNQSTSIKDNSVKKYSDESNMHYKLTEDSISKVNIKNNGLTSPAAKITLDNIINNILAFLSNLKFNSEKNFKFEIKIVFNNIISSFKSALTSFAQSIGSLTQNVLNKIDTLTSSFVNSVETVMTNIINDFKNTLTNIYNNISKQINLIADKFNKLTTKIKESTELNKKTKKDYYKRNKGESSTSKYIQANIPKDDGSMKTNTKVLDGTPSKDVLEKQLKVETNTVKEMTSNPLAGLPGLPSVLSLIPLNKSTKIEEPKPTDNKSQYGSISVNTNKGGFVEISDSTEGNVRKIMQHPTGTMWSMLDNGDFILKVTNDNTIITDGNWNITTSKDKVEIVSGDQKIEIRKNTIENIKGNFDSNIEGNSNSVIKGNTMYDVKGNLNEKIGGNVENSIAGNLNKKVQGSENNKTDGSKKETIAGSLTITVVGNANITSSGMINISGAAGVSLKGAAGALRIM